MNTDTPTRPNQPDSAAEEAPMREQNIEQLFDHLRGFEIPPVDQWQPGESLDIGLRIAADGRWYYRGSVIERRRMVKLFCSILRLDPDGRHYLVTPRLKYPVSVADAPFRAVEVNRQGAGREQNLFFRTNADDVVLCGRDHPLRVETDPVTGQPSPRVEVRNGLQAKICRSVYYELAQMLEPAEEESHGGDGGEIPGVYGVYSAGQFFPFGQSQPAAPTPL